MTPQDYKSRLQSTLARLEGIITATGKASEAESLKDLLASIKEQETKAGATMAQLDKIKARLVALLKECLEATEIEFAEMEEPDSADAELFKQYYSQLKEYKMELTSPSSELRKTMNTLMRRSRTNLLDELQSQAIIFPTECLDAILGCPQVDQKDGAEWVVEQINEALNTFLEEVNARLAMSFEAVNEILGSEIEVMETTCMQGLSFCRQNTDSMSDDMFGLVRQALPSIGLGTMGYGAASLVLGPAAGLLAGVAAGGLFVWKAHSSSSRQKKRMELKQQLSPKLTLAFNEIRTYVNGRYEDFEEAVGESIETMLEAINKEMQDCADALKSCDQESKAFEAQQGALNNRMSAIETHIKQLELLNTNPLRTKQNNKRLAIYKEKELVNETPESKQILVNKQNQHPKLHE